jgi:hypothetical protein
MRGHRFALEPDSPGEDVQIWHPEALPGAEVMLARHCTRHWTVLHDTYGFCHVPVEGNDPAGTSHWWYRGREYDCQAGGIMAVEPGEIHVTRRLRRPATFYWALHVPVPLVRLAAAGDETDRLPHLRIAQSNSSRLYAACDRLFRAMTRDATDL